MIVAILQSSIVLFIALCATRLFRRQSAATRHAIVALGLVGSLVIPFLPSPLPPLPSPMNQTISVPQATTQVTSEPPIEPTEDVSPSNAPLWIWLTGTAIMSSILIAGVARIGWLVLRSKPLTDARYATTCGAIAQLIGLNRRVQLLQNDRAVLGTWGAVQPKIFLPRDACQWSDERVRAVLTHELAHIKRFDWPLQIVAELARAVYWFNPLFWIACSLLRSESEHACDDAVLNSGFDPKDYATHLLDLARISRDSNRAWSAVLAMSRPPNLERRFVAMLNPSLNRRSVQWAVVVAIIVAVICLMLPVAALRARPILPPLPAPLAAPPLPVPLTALPKPEVPKPAVAKPSRTQGRADGSLAGAVSDASGAVIPGVRITLATIEQTQNGTAETAVGTIVSDETGRFTFPALTPGQYSLKAELPGFATFRKSSIEVKRGETIQQKIFMSVGGIVQRVEVSAAGRARPAVAPAGPQRIRVGGNVQAARLISQVKPVYPQNARDAGIEGTVHLRGIIGPEGNFISLRVVGSNNRDLANAALEAVRQWQYRPVLLNNEPIEVETEIDVDFKLVE